MKKNLKPCPACGSEIAKSATTCPHCGKTMTSVERIILLALAAVLILFLLGGGRYCSAIMEGNRQLEELQQR